MAKLAAGVHVLGSTCSTWRWSVQWATPHIRWSNSQVRQIDQDHNPHDLIHPPAACIKYKIYETYETDLEFI